MTSYEDTLTWAAQQTWFKWERNAIDWRGVIGREVNTIAFIYTRTVYEVNQDVWAEVVEIFGDPFA